MDRKWAVTSVAMAAMLIGTAAFVTRGAQEPPEAANKKAPPGKPKPKAKAKTKGGPSGLSKPGPKDTIRVNVYADNWFIMYVNGKLVAVDPIDFMPHNVVSFDLLPEYPMTIAIMAKDNADPKTGMEYNNSQVGDGGFVLKLGNDAVTNAQWKAKKFFWGPLNDDTSHPTVAREAIPENWYAVDFDDHAWKAAREFEVAEVDPKEPYYQHDFEGARFIWTDDLRLDNTIIFRTRIDKPGWKPRWNTKPDLDVSGAPLR